MPVLQNTPGPAGISHGSFLLHCFACGLVTRLVPHLLRVQSGVHTLVLPAAHETVETWKAGFNFVDMPEDDVR